MREKQIHSLLVPQQNGPNKLYNDETHKQTDEDNKGHYWIETIRGIV